MPCFENLIATQLVTTFLYFHGNKMFAGPLDAVLSQTKPTFILAAGLFIKNRFHIMLHLHLTVSLDSTRYFYRYFVGISHSHNACYIPHPSDPPCFNYPILLGVQQLMKVITQYSPTSCVLSEVQIFSLALHLQKPLTWTYHFSLYSSSNITWMHMHRDNFCMNMYRGVEVQCHILILRMRLKRRILHRCQCIR
jgi:hypothetical protein